MSDDRQPSRQSRIRRALTQPVTSVADALVPTLVDAVDLDETLSRIDVDELVQRVDFQAVMARLDVNELLDKVDVDALVDRIAISELIGKVDMNALLEGVDIDRLLSRIDVDQVLERIAIDALLKRIDVDELISRVDVDALIKRVDVDGLVQRVDVDGLIQRVAVDALIQRVDVDALIQRVDVDRLIQRVDVDALIQRVDVDALIQRLDVDALIQRVDMDALIQRVDIAGLTNRLELGAMVRRSTGGIIMSVLDLVRRQLVGLDVLVLRIVDGMLRRKPETLPTGPPALVVSGAVAAGALAVTSPTSAKASPLAHVSGRYAGPITRLVAFGLDLGIVGATFAIGTGLLAYLVKLVTGNQLDQSGRGWAWAIALVVWYFVYQWLGLALAGRTAGKAVVGLRVVATDGSPLTPHQSLLRPLAVPLSIILLGIGLIMGVVTKRRCALHDKLVGTAVVYDWGDRPAEMPAPLTRWLSKRGAIDTRLATAPSAASPSDAPPAAA